jgi:hypothetical protein
MLKITKRSAAIATAAVVAVGAAGAAWAAWGTDGVGSASATAGTANGISVTGGTITGTLFPGSGNHDITLTVTNTNNFKVNVTAVKVVDTNAVGDGMAVTVGAPAANVALKSDAAGTIADCQGTALQNGPFGKTGLKLVDADDKDDFTLVGSSFNLKTPVLLAATDGTATITIPQGIKMTNTSANACQGKSFSLELKAVSESAESDS